jgi:hypothetical protein
VQVTPKALDRIINRRAKVVVIDLTLENLRYAIEAIGFIRMARHDIAVFVRLDAQDRLSVVAGTLIGDAYLNRDGKDDVQGAYEEFLRRRSVRRRRVQVLRGSNRLARFLLCEAVRKLRSLTKPPKNPPPPAVPVHSLVDIIRIIHSRRERWAAQWTLRGDRKGQEVCDG